MAAYVTFDERMCKGCGLCVHFCAKKALGLSERINAAGYPVAALVKPEQCNGCALCAVMCPEVAIKVYKEAASQ
ncbi:MAG TPA: 4Fe-4S dicluster domain-containing protein [Bacillota bacterium]|jgi:2-oxoglutarate ferredoxin oxidoreductase subunit delta